MVLEQAIGQVEPSYRMAAELFRWHLFYDFKMAAQRPGLQNRFVASVKRFGKIGLDSLNGMLPAQVNGERPVVLFTSHAQLGAAADALRDVVVPCFAAWGIGDRVKYLRNRSSFIGLDRTMHDLYHPSAQQIRPFRGLALHGHDFSATMSSVMAARLMDEKRITAIIQRVATRLRQLHVRAVCLWNDVLAPDKLLVWAAQSVGIPTVVFQHGIFFENDVRGFTPVTADYFIAWGPMFADRLRFYGVPCEKIRVFGSPTLEATWRHVGRDSRALIRHQLAVSDKERLLVYLSQPYERYTPRGAAIKEQILSRLLEVCRRQANLRLMVKLHPSENRKSYAGLPETVLVSEAPLAAVLPAADTVVSIGSTGLIEAALLGIRTVSIETEPELRDFPFGELGFAVPCSSLDQLEAVLLDDSVMPHENATRHILFDGRVNERLKEFVKNELVR